MKKFATLLAVTGLLWPSAAHSYDLKPLDYPEYADRAGWEKFIGPDRDYLIRQGEKYLDTEFRYIPASVYFEFGRTGDRSSFRADYEARDALTALTLAELAEGKGRFMGKIMDAVWYFSEKISWVHPQHTKRKSTRRSLGDPDQEIIGITSAFTGVSISYAYRFFHKEWDKVDSSVSRAARQALDKHIFTPYLDETLDTANWWLGFTPGMPIINWCPWINSNVMLCFFLAQEDGGKTQAALEKSLRSIRGYLDYLPEDGGCDEGPSYWEEATGKVYDYFYLLKMATGGEIDRLSDPRLKKMGEFKTDSYIGGGWITNYADGFGREGGNGNFLYRFGKDVGSGPMTDMALLKCTGKPSGDMFNRLECMRRRDVMLAERDSAFAAAGGKEKFREKFEASLRDNWYPKSEVTFIRRGKWFLSALGYNNYAGRTNDTHNHNDIGSCVLFYDRMPVLLDMGKSTPVDGTYDAARYTFPHIRSDYHNVPTVRGTLQGHGAEFRAVGTRCDLKKGTFSCNLRNAYPASAGIRDWVRSYRLDARGLLLSDSFTLSEGEKDYDIHFMVRGEITLKGKGRLVITVYDYDFTRQNDILVEYPASMSVEVEEMNLTDKEFTKVWGPRMARLRFTPGAGTPGRLQFRLSALTGKSK